MSCGCGTSSTALVADQGIEITGSGSPTNPYRIKARIPDFSTAFRVTDSGTINLDLTGAGTIEDPLSLTATAHLAMTDLADVTDDVAPAVGDVPVWTIGPTGGGWTFQPPPAVAAGTLSKRSNSGLVGDGSGGDPLGVATSGIWGVNVGTSGGDSASGQAIYVDVNGQLRAAPVTGPDSLDWASIAGKPTLFASRWDLVQQKPATFPASWGSIAGKPSSFPPASHDHDDRYMTATQSNARFATQNSLSSPRAVSDVTGTHNMGLRWNGARIVGRVDTSEWELATASDINSLSGRIDSLGSGTGKANSFNDVNTVRYARGPDATAYSRGMSGAGYFAVWMDNTYQFGRNTSSRRFKTDIEALEIPADVALDLARLVRRYHRIGAEDIYEVGMIAEEVHEVFPEAVTWFTDPEAEDAEPVIDGIRYDLLAIPALTALADLHDAHVALAQRLERIEAHLGLTEKED